MTFITLSGQEFSLSLDRAKEVAKKKPVLITDRGKPAHVLLSFEEYQRLMKQKQNIADALAMPGIGNTEFDPLHITLEATPMKLSQSVKNLRANQVQAENEKGDKNIGSESYFSLTGLQFKIAHFIYQHCKAHKSRITQPLSIEYIALSCKINGSSVKKTIQRLEEKGVLVRKKYKIGRNGWTCYELPDALYKEILCAEENKQLEVKLGTRRLWDSISEFKPTSEAMPPAEGVEKTAQHSEGKSEIIGKTLDAELGLVNNEPDKAYITEVVKRLCGQQKELLFYIVENCKFRNLLHTTAITNETLRSLLNTDKNSVKTTVHRLVKKKVVGRKEGKRGKGGFCVFTVSRAVMEAVMESE